MSLLLDNSRREYRLSPEYSTPIFKFCSARGGKTARHAIHWEVRMLKQVTLMALFLCLGAVSASAQAPCAAPSNKLACALPQEFGSGKKFDFSDTLEAVGGHPFHFINDFSATLKPLTTDISRQANLLPIASPSS